MLIWLNFYCHIWSQNVPKVKWGENRKKKVFCTKMRIAILISKRFPPTIHQHFKVFPYYLQTTKSPHCRGNPLTVGKSPYCGGFLRLVVGTLNIKLHKLSQQFPKL